ncbi:MAG TPA: hypothetical protein VNG93_11515 [Candidatus Dormibacteraeota bacterium]|nr:hypothetical protein [Candidatus Dormibacteraeota bacterium]
MPLKFYPDRPWPALRKVLLDLLALLWVVFWGGAGWLTYQTVIGLEVIADGIRDTGKTFNDWLQSFRNAVPRGIPYVSSFLQDQASQLERHTGDPLIALSQTVRHDIAVLALALALFIALPPIAFLLLTYSPHRWREAREMGSALAFVRAAIDGGRTEQAKAVLAYRALANLNFTQLMRTSRDPVGDLANRDYDRLAAAMMDRAGLDPWRLAELPDPDRKLIESRPEIR